MSVWEILLLAVALAMDAFAVSICKGLSTKESYLKTGLVCGIWFGFFQALMPFLGWLLGSFVAEYVARFSSYIAFALLAFLGIKMIVEARRECACCECSEEETQKNASLGARTMLAFAIATSIDALAAGVTFAAMNVNVVLAISMIGVTTFLCSFIGASLGAKIGERWKYGAELAGGIILILIGLKILIEHLVTLFA